MSDGTVQADRYEKRFGVIAIERGFITPEDLFEALKIQVREELEGGSHRLIGEVLLARDCITIAQVEEVLEVMAKLSSVFG